MASTIFYQGKVVARPGSYSEIDASGLESVGLGASGIVAIVGTSEGGTPTTSSTEPDDLLRARTPAKVRKYFRSGDLREAGCMIFEPSNDPAVGGGAQEVVFCKTDQAEQATRTFSNSLGTAMTVTSRDYGEFTNQIAIEHEAGTDTGSKLITVTFEDTTEVEDNVGGEDIFTIEYREPTAGTGWDNVRAQMLSTGLRINATRREVGLSDHIDNAATATEVVRILSSDAADTTQSVTIYGINTSNVPVRETLTLNGTSTVTGVQTWNAVYGAILDEAAAGNVTVERTSGTDILVIPAASLTQGLVLGETMFVANAPVILTASAASTANILLWGRSTTGVVQAERVVLRGEAYASGVSPFVETSSSWSQIDVIVLGNLTNTVYLGIQAVAVETSNTVQTTVARAADYVNARQLANPTPDTDPDGFDFIVVTSTTSFPMDELDLSDDDAPATNSDFTSVTPVGTNIDGVVVGFEAKLQAMIDFYTDRSELASAERIAFSPKIVDVTVGSATTVTLSIDGFTISGTGGTVNAARDSLITAINTDRRVYGRVEAASNGTGVVRVTALTPSGFTLTESDANLTTSTIQSTTGVGSAPDDTSMPEFLTGGSAGTATFADYQNALNVLKRVRVNSIVVMSADPAVHAAVDAHCAYMAGLGRSERDAFVGLMNADLDDVADIDEIKDQIVDLNSRHIRAFAQRITRFNTAGERTVFDPPFQAVIAAGMQAGARIGTSLTFKYANVLDVTQDSTWNPLDDAEEMIQAGLCFMEKIDGVGRRFVRNVTTWLKSNNIAFIEGSVNQAVNYAVYEFRTAMENAVGQPGFAGTLAAARNLAHGKLGALVGAGALVEYRSLSLELVVDVLDISVEMAPIIPINFVRSTVHLVTTAQAA